MKIKKDKVHSKALADLLIEKSSLYKETEGTSLVNEVVEQIGETILREMKPMTYDEVISAVRFTILEIRFNNLTEAKIREKLSVKEVGIYYCLCGEYQKAIKYYESVLEKDPKAHVYKLLGDMYYYGLGVIWKDIEKAKELYEKAVYNGEKEASAITFIQEGLCAVGKMYREGILEKKDLVKARDIFDEAILFDSADAYHMIADMLCAEGGNSKIATRIKLKAIDQYEKDKKNKPNFEDRIKKLITKNISEGTRNLDEENKMSLVNQKSFESVLQAASLGSPYGMYLVGLYYECGYGVEIDLEEAFKWYTLAAESGYDATEDIIRLKGVLK